MKIDRLRIREFRGIRDLSLEPGGKNLLVWGGNGTGKSGVVDAIDFLLTGRIARLSGPGTGRIDLHKHGPHVVADVESASVEAYVSLEDASSVRLMRQVGSPNVLLVEPESARPSIESEVRLARQGQRILTRREILSFIASDPSARAEHVRILLNLNRLENLRSALGTVRNRLEQRAQAAQRRQIAAENSLTAATGSPAPGTLDRVNELRTALGAQPTTDLSRIRDGLSAGTEPRREIVVVPADVSRLADLIERLPGIEARIAELEVARGALTAIPDLRRRIQNREMLEQGSALLDGSGLCPLCRSQWEPEALRRHIDAELAASRDLREQWQRYTADAHGLEQELQAALQLVERFAKAEAQHSLAMAPESFFRQWGDGLEGTVRGLKNIRATANRLPSSVRPSVTSEVLREMPRRITDEIRRHQSARDEVVATLGRIEQALIQVRTSEQEMVAARLSSERADLSLRTYLNAQRETLNQLYERVAGRFGDLYCKLHPHEAKTFAANLSQTPGGAGLDLDVDFMGVGRHPANALHSEGHQDSMGLCLFLALAEELETGPPPLILLDDVVMSVDRDHREDICSVLREEFPETQFVITTHDLTWAHQLKSSGVVTQRNFVQFRRWSLGSGPIVGDFDQGLWSDIDRLLKDDQVGQAAWRLRHESERFFEAAADALRASVPYRSDHQWTLGDFLSPVEIRLRDLLKKAKRSADSWNRRDLLESIVEVESQLQQARDAARVDAWKVNPEVHANAWIESTAQEFADVVAAYRTLMSQFQCSACERLLSVHQAAGEDTALGCPCGVTSWSLRTR